MKNISHYNGFTLLEIVLSLVFLSIVTVSVIALMSRATKDVNKIRQEIIAINLAREGIESVYNRRDTNWTKRSYDTDQYRLCVDDSCSEWFHTGYRYTLSYSWWSINFTWLYYEWPLRKNNDFLLKNNEDFLFTGNTRWWTYYRAIQPIWLYLKDTTTTGWIAISCEKRDSYYGFTIPCWNSAAKEFRFCSRVEYDGVWAGQGNVELCGWITNYKE